MIKKLIVGMIMSMFLATQVMADYIVVVPQKPGAGTSQWAAIVVKELRKYLDENIVIRHIPGARDMQGFNKFHNDLREDDTVIMVSHGGNGVSFLQENVDYDYSDYESIGIMNLNIIAGKIKGQDMTQGGIKFAAGSGMIPEGLAMTMLLCGPDKTIEQYVTCFKDNVRWVKGMSGGERRLAFKRGELNATRENPAAYKKHVESNDNAEIWFHHGILQADGSHADDPNHPGFQFEALFEERWGVAPSGKLYDAYKLVKSFRDGMQKAIWVNKGNPNADKLREALRKVATNPESVAAIVAAVGHYEWIIGEDGNAHRDTLMTFITEDALKTLVHFNAEAFGINSVYKEHLVK